MSNGQIIKKYIEDNAVGAAKIQVENDLPLRFRNAADSADIDLFKVDSADLARLLQDLLPSGNQELNIGSGNVGLIKVNAANVGNDNSFPFTGDTDVTGLIITNIPSTEGLVAGMNLMNDSIDPNLPSSIVSVDGPNQITIADPATASQVGLNFYAYGGFFIKTRDEAGSAGDIRGSGVSQFRSGNVSGAGNTANSGQVNVSSGNASDGQSGNIRVRTGTSTNGNSGSPQLISGNSTNGDSGDVLLQTGTAGGVRGIVNLNGRHVTANSTAVKDVADPTDPQDAATKAYVDAAIGGTTPFRETFVLTAPDLVNGYVDLTGLKDHNSVYVAVRGAAPLLEGATYEYTLSDVGPNTRVTFVAAFLATLIVGDVVQVQGTN